MSGAMRWDADGGTRIHTPTYHEFLRYNQDVVLQWYRAHRELQTALCLASYDRARDALGRLEHACFLLSGAIENLRPYDTLDSSGPTPTVEHSDARGVP